MILASFSGCWESESENWENIFEWRLRSSTMLPKRRAISEEEKTEEFWRAGIINDLNEGLDAETFDKDNDTSGEECSTKKSYQ